VRIADAHDPDGSMCADIFFGATVRLGDLAII